MKKTILKIMAITGICTMLSGCALLSYLEEEEKPEAVITFHIATTKSVLEGLTWERVVMPISGISLMMKKEEFMYTGDLKRVDVAETSTDISVIKGLYFTCTERGSKRLYQASASEIRGYIVAMKNSKPVALRRIDTIISEGKLFMIPELSSDVDLFEFTEDLNKDIELTLKMNEENDSW